jgi:hypothetical protein
LPFPRLLQQWSTVLQGKCMHNSFLIVARSLSVGTQWAKSFQGRQWRECLCFRDF